MFRRAVFNVAAGNDDDHGRNHAFLMDNAGEWRMSPAYDLTRTTNPLLGGMRSAAVLGKAVDVSRDDMKRLGDGQGVRRVDAVIDEVVAAVKDWDRWAGEAGLSRFRTSQVREELPGTGW
jgi:serine/threonine-protein kinase HipA